MRRRVARRPLRLCVGLEEDADDAEAGEGLGFLVFDVVDGGGEGALAADGDDFGHFLGRDPGVAPDDRNHRNIDIGKDIGGHADDSDAAEHHDEQRHDDEGVGAF